MTDAVRLAGQTLLNGALYNGLAAKDGENHALRMAQIQSRTKNSDSDKVEDLERENRRLKGELSNSRIVNQQYRDELVQRDTLITEWMHSNEAFKVLAVKYGKKIGLSAEQRQEDFDNAVLDVAEEEPRYKDTKLGAAKRVQLSKTC